MISISHWGMFAPVAAPIAVMGYKVKNLDQIMAEWGNPAGYIEIFPLEIGEPQPIYQRLDFGKLD